MAADWLDIGELLKAYRGDLTKKATGFQQFYSQLPNQQNKTSLIPSPSSLSTPIQWNDFTDQANSSVHNRGGPSTISKIFDVLSRPNYALAEGSRQVAIKDGGSGVNQFLSGAWQGFQGKKKTRFSRVYDQMSYNSIVETLASGKLTPEEYQKTLERSQFTDILKNPSFDPQAYKTSDKGEGHKFNAINGFILDVATDPLNFIGGPLVRGAKLANQGVKRARGIENLDTPGVLPYRNPLTKPLNVHTNPASSLPQVPTTAFVSDKINPVMRAFSNTYKNPTLRPEVMAVKGSAKSRAVTRVRALNLAAKTHKPVEIQQAFKVSQGATPPAATTQVNDLAQNFDEIINDLFFRSDLRKYATMAFNGIKSSKQEFMKELNEQLAINGERVFRFSDEPVDMHTGGTKIDLKNGNDWLDSWKYADIKDPLAFVSRLSHAVESVTMRNQFLDDFAERFGKTAVTPGRVKLANKKKSMEYTAGIRNKRLQGYYFDPQIAKEMNHVLKNWDQVTNPRSSLIKLLDQSTSLWKTGVTIYAPSHHIRNLIGDTYFNWMAGVNSVKPYRIAARILAGQRGKYNGIAGVSDLTSKTKLDDAMRYRSNTALTTRRGIPFSDDAVYTAAYNKGLLQSANTLEDLGENLIDLKNLSNPVLNRAANPFGGRVSAKIRSATELREHYVRLAHFADALKKSKAGTYEEAVTDAANQVRKWHPDGMDLTDVERAYFRRAIPFYSWTRKAIPLVIESTVMKPGKALLYPRFMQMIQDAQGVPNQDIMDPFPEDQLFPDWIKEKGIGPVAYHGMDGLSGILGNVSRSGIDQQGDKAGYNVVNPSNPLIDTVAQLSGMGRFRDTASGIGSMANPLFRIPAEVATGHTVVGTPIGYDPANYTTQQIPILAYLAQQGNITPFGTTTKRGQREGIPNWEGIMNYLTALGIRGTGASIKEAEFEAKERAKKGER